MKRRRAFFLDLNKCTGCHACEMACQIANDLPGERRWRRVRTFNGLHVHGVEVAHLSLACNHCADAPCMEACPARAIYRDDSTNAVLIDEIKCVGCRYCSWACPYGAPRYDEESGVMTKCDFCVDRQRAGGEPACVTGCPTGALDWGELREDELTGGVGDRGTYRGVSSGRDGNGGAGRVPGMAETGAKPSIRIMALKPARMAPRQTEPPSMPPWRAPANRIVPQITLSREWPLAAFTLLMTVLTGLFLGSLLGAPAPNGVLFPIAGAAGLLLSASHLGRKTRVWRAGLHADRSWLSREILLFCSFLLLASLALQSPAGHDGAGPWASAYRNLGRPAVTFHSLDWLAAALGVAALFSADRVYRAAIIRGGGVFHSAELTGTGLLLAAAWSGNVAAFVILAGIKAFMYGRRKRSRFRLGLPVRGKATVLRLGTLAAAGVAAWRGASPTVTLALIVASELIDRAEYYDELEIPTPESLMRDELASRPQAVAALTRGSSS